MGETNSSTDAARVPVDDLFEALSEAENRYVLAYLAEADGPVATRELVADVLERTACPPDLGDAEFERQVRSRVEDEALPTLDELGLLDYDRRETLVRSTEATATAKPHLELALGEHATE